MTSAADARARRRGPVEPQTTSMTDDKPTASWLEQDVDLREYLDVLRRRRKTIVLCAVAALVVALLYTLSQTPTYTATATVQIEQERQGSLAFEDMWSSWSSREAFYQTQYRLLASRVVAGRVAEKLGMVRPAAARNEGSAAGTQSRLSAGVSWVRSLPSEGLSAVRRLLGTAPSEIDPGAMAELEANEDPAYRAAINRVLGGLSVRPDANSNIVSVTWRSSDPVMTARVSNAVVDEYIKHSLEAKYQASEQATQFLTEQIALLREEINEAEGELQQYGSERDILSLNENQDTVTQGLTSLNEEVLAAQSQRVRAQIEYEQLRGAVPGNLPEVFSNPLIQSMSTDLAALRQQESDLGRRFTAEHPDMRRLVAQIEDLEARIATEEQRIFDSLVANAEGQFQIAQDRENRLSSMLQTQRNQTREQNRDLVRYRQLQIEVENKQELLDTLLQRLNEAGVSTRLQGSRTSSLRKIDAATVPRTPSSPDTGKNLMYGALFGLVAGLGLALFQEHLDNSLSSAEDVQHRLGLATLAWVPALQDVAGSKGWGYGETQASDSAGASPELVTLERPRSAIAEAYRTLRTSVLLSRAGHPPKVLLTTSSVPGEGKTTTSINLAVTLAQAGKRVLLIDADMRRPRLHRTLGLDGTRGLTQYLTGACTLKDAVQATRAENLWAMPCGVRPPNPAELLVAGGFEEMIEQARESFDNIIIDTPPILAVTDPLIVAPWADGLVLVVRGGETPYPLVQQALRKVNEVGGKTLGVVLNNVELERVSYQGYYRYDDPDPVVDGRRPPKRTAQAKLRPVKTGSKEQTDAKDEHVRVSNL